MPRPPSRLEGLTLENGKYRILALNPGSTSTKAALFENETEIWNDTQRYDVDVIRSFASVTDQEGFRLEAIRDALRRHETRATDLDAVVGRGGLLKPIPGGTYLVEAPMLEDVKKCRWGSHASNLKPSWSVTLAKDRMTSTSYLWVSFQISVSFSKSATLEIGRASCRERVYACV